MKTAFSSRIDGQEIREPGLLGHNHVFFVNEVVARLQQVNAVPSEYDQLARLLAATGDLTARIDAVLTHKWNDENPGMMPPWNREHLRYLYPPSGTSNEIDFTGLMEMLDARKTSTGLQRYLHFAPETGRMDRVWVEMPGAREEWASGGETNVVLFDPTHGANRYRWKLCFFSTLCRKTGKTIILAYALLEHEGKADFLWSFRCLHDALGVPPFAVFTDGCPKILAALQVLMSSVWLSTQHFLCVFHISKNVWDRLRSKFLGDRSGEKWKAVHDCFWRLAKNTDSSFRSQFDSKWATLVASVQETATNTYELDEAVEWLKQLGTMKHKFAYCYTWAKCTQGVHSTQRAEAMQNVSKSRLGMNTRTPFVQVHEKLDQYNVDASAKRDEQEVRMLCGIRIRGGELPAFLKSLVGKVYVFALDLVAAQFYMCMQYVLEEQGPPTLQSDQLTFTYIACRDNGLTEPPAELQLDYDDDGHVRSYSNGEDFGSATKAPPGGRCLSITISPEGVTRRMQLVAATCSCQTGISWGTGLCRHILKACVRHEVQSIAADKLFFSKWLIRDKDELLRLQVQLARAPRPSSVAAGSSASGTDAASGGSSGQTQPKMDRRSRREQLQPLVHELLDIGCSDDTSYGNVHSQLERALQEMRSLTSKSSQPAVGSGKTSRKRKQRNKSAPVDLPPPNNNHPLAIVPSGLRAALVEAIPQGMQVASCSPPPLADPENVLAPKGPGANQLVGHFILYLQRALNNKKVWQAGKILMPLTNERDCIRIDGTDYMHTFKVDYSNHNTRRDATGEALLETKCLNLHAKQKPDVNDWLLLEGEDLHNAHVVAGQVTGPSAPKKKGRPASQIRKKPVHGGPTGHLHTKRHRAKSNQSAAKAPRQKSTPAKSTPPSASRASSRLAGKYS